MESPPSVGLMLLLFPFFSCACSEPSNERGIGSPPFLEVASQKCRVMFEDSEQALVGDLAGIAPRPNGNILVVDPMTHRVLEFDQHGKLLRWLGRPGDGPGEFRFPFSILLLKDGRLLVMSSSRISRLSRDLEFEENLVVKGEFQFAGLFPSSKGVLLGTRNHRRDGFSFSFLDPNSGETRNQFVRQHSLLLSVPYWNALFQTHIADFGNRFVVSHNMIYPIYVYDYSGMKVDSLVTPPSSWIEADRPEPGEFSLVGPGAVEEWQRGFTITTGLFSIDDRRLVVVHRAFPRESTDPAYLADIYDEELRKIHTDVLLPGKPILGGECLWILSDGPPAPWTIDCFELS